MNKTLLFIPDISGFTQFVQNTEAEHSQHVDKKIACTVYGLSKTKKTI